MEIWEKVPQEFLSKICRSITPDYVTRLLKENHMPSDEETVMMATP